MARAYEKLLAISAELRDLGALRSLAGWDQETHMPPKGAANRAEQLSALSGVIHEKLTDPQIGELIAQSADAASEAFDQANLRVMKKEYDRACKLPTELVSDLARTGALAQQHWKEARKKDEFARFLPWLEKLLRLQKQKAACLDPDKPPYDVLLDLYEPNMTTAQLQPLFSELRDGVVDLVQRIDSSGKQPRTDFLGTREYPQAAQQAFLDELLEGLGFDREAGRIDVAAHPFCCGLSTSDVRLTVRYNEDDPRPSIFGLIHEAGHGLYEQGLPIAHDRQPAAAAASLGLHESQSRLWENTVGRSRPFWQHFYPKLQSRLSALSDIDVETWYGAINEAKPSLIRVESDEVTYNLHIILRMELEIAMLDGDLAVRDLPAAWNEKMQQYFGIQPPSDADGVLQDVHWSLGAMGYFPTYTLGNLYGAQLCAKMRSELTDLDEQTAAGNLIPVLDWMRTHIHSQGRLHEPADLVSRATGEGLSAGPLLAYLNQKYGDLYDLG